MNDRPERGGPSQALAGRLAELRARIERAGADPDRVTLVAVTKGFGPDAVRHALDLGLHDVGENYAQELLAKAEAGAAPAGGAPSGGADPAVRWHFIGRLQRNKVRRIAPLVHLWQSVDRIELGREIARHAPGARVLVQVDVSGEQQKGGCPPTAVAALVTGLRHAGLDVRGLMAVGPTGEPEAARPGFGLLRHLADDLDLDLRSMGMSADLEIAVSEGSNMVRLGTALFGSRPTRTAVQG